VTPSKSNKKSPRTWKWRFPSSTLIVEIPELAKAEPSMTCNEAGRQIDLSDEQLSSALASIRFSLDPDSNVNEKSDRQNSKHVLQRISTEAGIQIDSSNSQK
jgi:hypothetical protein